MKANSIRHLPERLESTTWRGLQRKMLKVQVRLGGRVKFYGDIERVMPNGSVIYSTRYLEILDEHEIAKEQLGGITEVNNV